MARNEPFPSFNAETKARESDGCVGEILELEKTQDLLDIFVLFFFRHFERLTKISGIAKSFSDGPEVMLLSVKGFYSREKKNSRCPFVNIWKVIIDSSQPFSRE